MTTDLTAAERQFLTFALDLAFDQMVSGDGFTDEDEAALERLRRLTAAPAAPTPVSVPADGQRRALARIRQMADAWEQQLPEVIRTPAVVSALRAALEGAGPAVADAEQAATRGAVLTAATCSAQYHGPGEDTARLCIRAAQHTGKAHTDEHGFHWSDTVAMYPLADGTLRTGVNLPAELRRMADEEQPACIHPEGYDRECPCPPSCACCRVTAADEEQPGCPDPIECGHEAALGQAQQEVRRLGLMVDEYGVGASALTDKLKRVRDLHRETCPFALGQVKAPAFACSMCELLDAPATVARQDGASND